MNNEIFRNLDLDNIENLNLNPELENKLKIIGIHSIYDLLDFSINKEDYNSLYKIRYIDEYSKNDIINKIHSYGLKFSNEEEYVKKLTIFMVNNFKKKQKI